ncbi:MAG: Bug family tripartite tricarboxylate transporter substrate binding protein [Vulcanimicrobiaceae bacterium]
MNRTTFTASILGAIGAATVTTPRLARAADEYPSRPITLIVPWGPGGGSDQVGRAVAKNLQDVLKGTSIPVINVPGADGNDGMVKLVGGDADGYTMVVLIADTFVGNITAKTPPAWHMSDITPLAMMNTMPFAYYLSKDSPYKDWASFEKAAKTTQMRVAITGYGSAQDVGIKYFASKGSLKFAEVPFSKPGERYAALLGNQVDVMCDAIGNVSHYVESGQMKPICVMAEKRLAVVPYCPTANELGYKVVLEEWRTIAVKAGTDPKKVAFLDRALAATYKTPDFQAFLKSSWSDPDSYKSAKDLPGFFAARRKYINALIAATP